MNPEIKMVINFKKYSLPFVIKTPWISLKEVIISQYDTNK